MLKKISLILIFLLMAWLVRADDRSQSILSGLSAALDQYGVYEVSFRVSGQGMEDVPGNYIVNGNQYSIVVAGQRHFSDGTDRYEIHEDIEEVIIDRVDNTSRNIFSNPARAFEFAQREFESRWVRQQGLDGRMVDVITLVPADSRYSGRMIIDLYVDSETNLPTFIIYDYDGQRINIDIREVSRVLILEEGTFQFIPSMYAGYEIIDFRDSAPRG